jgi:hypothetical protein
MATMMITAQTADVRKRNLEEKRMSNLRDYFEQNRGLGVLSTANGEGKVNAAVYATPHVVDEKTIAFLMADHRTREYLETNSHAVYLFKEEGKYEGIRLYLTKIGVEKSPEAVREWRTSRGYRGPNYSDEGKWIVTFLVEESRPLTGAEE